MGRTLFLRILPLLAVSLVAGGCASTAMAPADLKGYDSTYTKQMSVADAKKFSDVSYYGKILNLKDPNRPRRAKPYFVEFRARGAVTYGHASVVFGKLDRNGRVPVDKKGRLIPGMTEITGLHPATVTMAVGHVVPVPAMTSPSDGDHENAYILKRYRIALTKEEFARVVAVIKLRKRQAKVWHGVMQNCVTYVAEIAGDLGLEVPERLPLPATFVAELSRLNG